MLLSKRGEAKCEAPVKTRAVLLQVLYELKYMAAEDAAHLKQNMKNSKISQRVLVAMIYKNGWDFVGKDGF